MKQIYKVEMWGGDPNGAIRYYDKLGIAIGQAKRYATRNAKIFGLSNHAYAEVYIIQKDKWKLLYTYGY